jgi:hypothetical protein
MSDNDEIKSSKPYVVGYGNPPAHTRFKRGQSGNPAGRRRGSKNFSTELKERLQERVVIIESGKTKTISMQEAITKQLVNKAAGGELRAISLVVTLKLGIEQNSEGAAEPASLNAQDKKLILSLLEQYARSTKE